jgi:phosphoglycerol transferase MdoB-like AlkP superfamily enzyme
MKELYKNKRFRHIMASLLFLLIAAILLMFFLEYRYFLNDFGKTWSFFFKTPQVFFFNAFLLWLLLVIIWAICGRPILAAGIGAVALLVITYIHIAKYNSRGYPLLPEDFQLASEASTLTKFVDIWSIVRLVIAIIITAGLFFAFSYYCGKKFHLKYEKEKDEGLFKRHFVIVRTLILAASITIFLTSTIFVRHNEGIRYEPIFLGTRFTAWNQNRNYDENGFILGFLYNFQKLSLDTPKNYSEERIGNTKKKYEMIANYENEGRINPADEDVSVVVILNESFFDPTVEFNGKKMTDYYRNEGGDIMPNLHRIQKETASGNMYTLDYGGGTANIEFEVFTGLSNFWMNIVPYTSLIPKTGKVPSIASMLKSKKFVTTAIHPFNGGMYKRNISLKNEGFDTFTTELEMDYTEHDGNSEYINDKSAYDQTLKTLREGEGNQMIGLITMQNHTPYNDTNYETYDFTVEQTEGISDTRKSQLEVYYQSLHTSDQYLGEFIDELKTLDKKVVVLFFGDHAAGLFNITNNSNEKEVRDLSRVTPYFIYANYDAGLKAGEKLPTTSPNCLVNTMLDKLNWQKDTYMYLAADACKEQPILATTYLEGLDFEMTEVLEDYKLLTYDILGGKKFWYSK